MLLRPALLFALLAVVCASPLAAEELPLGMTFAGENTVERPARYDITVDEAGVLSVVVRADADVSITMYDSLGQVLNEGTVDRDFQGNFGAEQAAFVLGQGGAYVVEIRSLSSDAEFQMGATWLAVEAVETPEDPLGQPETAAELTLDENIFGEINESVGDILDWYRFTAPAAGTLTVGTRTRNGDVVLSCYADGEYDDYIEYSDQDLQGDTGTERITISLTADEVVYFRVNAYGSQAEYAIRGVFESDAPLEEEQEQPADDDTVEGVDDAAEATPDTEEGDAEAPADETTSERAAALQEAIDAIEELRRQGIEEEDLEGLIDAIESLQEQSDNE